MIHFLRDSKSKMAPREEIETLSSPITRSFKPFEKTQDVPVTSSSSEVQDHDTNDASDKPVIEDMKDEVETIVSEDSESLLQTGGENIITPDESVSSCLVDRAGEYFASFRISQFGIRLTETELSVIEKPVALMSTWMSSKIKSSRRYLRYLRRAGLRVAGDGGCKSGSLVLHLIHVLHLNFLFGFMGIKVIEADIEPTPSIKNEDNSVSEDGLEIDDDSDEDPEYVLSSDSEDSLEYRSDIELDDCSDQENLDETDSSFSSDEADECNTPACSKAEHTNVAEVEEANDNE